MSDSTFLLPSSTPLTSLDSYQPVSAAQVSGGTSSSGTDSLTSASPPPSNSGPTNLSTDLDTSTGSRSTTSRSLSTFMTTSVETSTTPSSTRTSSIQSTSASSHWSYTNSSLPPTSPTLPFSMSTSYASTSSFQSTATQTTVPNLPSTVLTTFTIVKSSPISSPYLSTVTVNSVIPGSGGTGTYLPTSSGVLSTVSPGSAVGTNIAQSPGTITALVLGVIGAIAFGALWLFCARRRQRKLRDAAILGHGHHASGPLEGEVLEEDFGYSVRGVHDNASYIGRGASVMEERYAGLLAALQAGEVMGTGVEQASTTAVYGSHGDGLTDVENLARASSPTLPLSSLPSEEPTFVPLSPPPIARHQQMPQPVPPPSAYFSSGCRRSSPGPDASAWFGGYNIAPSCASHYAPSQTLGSGSGSGSVHALSRTQTGSEEPLLGIGMTSEPSHGCSGASRDNSSGGHRLCLGSAFGSPVGSLRSPSDGWHRDPQGDASGSSRYDMRSASGGSGYTRSATPSSFDVLRSVSSQGALSSVYSHGHGPNQGFRFGFGTTGSSSSGSTGKKRGRSRNNFGNPPTSFRAWKERGSGESERYKEWESEKERIKGEKDWRRSFASSASASGSADEKQDRSSPGLGVRALLGRLRRAGHTPSPRSSTRDLPSPGPNPMDVEKVAGTGSIDVVTTGQVATPRRRHYSFVLSNPDSRSPSPCSGNVVSSEASPPHDISTFSAAGMFCSPSHPVGPQPQSLHPPVNILRVPLPSPVPTEESRLAEGLLHPRLRVEGRSNSSLRDFEDYSRPIGGLVNNQMHSTTTFDTVEDVETGQGQGTALRDTRESSARNSHEQVMDVFGAAVGIQRESWFMDDR